MATVFGGLAPPAFAMIVLGVLASWFDLRTRRLPNPLTFGAAALAVAYSATTGGVHAAVLSVAGWLVGLALFLPFFALGGLGAGDVKLLGAYGAWAGPAAACWMALYAAMAGGVLAVVVALAAGYLPQAVRNVSYLVMFWRTVGVRPLPELTLADARGPRLPYAVAVTAGAFAWLWLH